MNQIERIERDILRLKTLPDHVLSAEGGRKIEAPLGDWFHHSEVVKLFLLHTLDWRGISDADRQKIMAREVDLNKLPLDALAPIRLRC